MAIVYSVVGFEIACLYALPETTPLFGLYESALEGFKLGRFDTIYRIT